MKMLTRSVLSHTSSHGLLTCCSGKRIKMQNRVFIVEIGSYTIRLPAVRKVVILFFPLFFVSMHTQSEMGTESVVVF